MCSKILATVLVAVIVSAPSIADDAPMLGQPVTDDEIEAISLTVLPDGQGLPKGSGNARTGEGIYAIQCAACHGENGVGGPLIAMAGKPQRGTDWTVGSVYEHATSIFDYVRRGMPAFTPKQLSDDEVYSVTAYILYLNGLTQIDETIDRRSLPEKKMPAASYSRSKWEEEKSD